MYTNSKPLGNKLNNFLRKTSFPTRLTLLTRSTLNIILFVSYSIYKNDSLSPNTCKLAEGVLTQKKDVTPLQLINAIRSLPVKVNTNTGDGPFAASSSSILTVWLHSRWPAEDISRRILSENTVSNGLVRRSDGVFA